MIGYLTIGTRDLEAAGRFYDALLAEMGGRRTFETERIVGWGFSNSATVFCVCLPFDGEAASAGNGSMVALKVEHSDEVDALHAKALSLGATTDGDPGPRGRGSYAGYFRDLDGNKLNLICYG